MIFTIPLEGAARLGGATSIARSIGLVVFVSWLATIVVTKQIRRISTIHILVLAYVLWFGLSDFWSHNPSITSFRFKTYIQLLLFFVIIWDMFLHRGDVDWGLQAFLIGCYFAAIGTWHSFLTGQTYNAFQERYTSFAGIDPNSAGVVMALAIPMAWWLAQESDVIRNRKWLRMLNYAYIPLATFAILLTASRTALLAVIIAYMFILVAAQSLGWITRIFIIAMLGGAIYGVTQYVPAASFERLNTIGESISENDLTGRGEIWQEGIEFIRDYPVLGIGGGNFAYRSTIGLPAHNLVISVWAETGLIGVVLYLSIIGVVIWSALRHRPMEAFFWCTLILIWATGAASLNWEARKQTWLIFGLTMASAYSIENISRLLFVREYQPRDDGVSSKIWGRNRVTLNICTPCSGDTKN